MLKTIYPPFTATREEEASYVQLYTESHRDGSTSGQLSE